MCAEAHSFKRRARFEIIWIKELVEAEIASCTDDSVPSDPEVKEIELLKMMEATGQPAIVEVHTVQVVERVGVSRQLDGSQSQPVEVSLSRSTITGVTKRRAEIQLTPNSVGSCIDVLRVFDVPQVEQADWMLPIETKESSVNKVEDVSHQCDRHTGKFRDLDKYTAERKKEFDQMKGFQCH